MTATAVVIASLRTDAVTAQPTVNRVFGPAINQAQQRVVKIYGGSAGRVKGYSSGIIVSDDGRIVTMQGVYLDSSQVRVTLPDGESYTASMVRRDRTQQLALLKIDAETPNFFELSEKRVARKGDWVIAVSNAFKVADGREPLSVNLGIVSLATSIEARFNRRDVAYDGELVLIDAITSNPGAGGGAVVNTEGELVGMIGKIIDSSETNTRLNYAVPVSSLYQFVNAKTSQIAATEPKIEKKPVELGVRLFRMDGPRGLCYIDRVIPRSPAAAAGLRRDDLIISVGGEKADNIRQYEQIVETLSPGKEVVLIIKRGTDLLPPIRIVPMEKKSGRKK